jgi:hypothetical protein
MQGSEEAMSTTGYAYAILSFSLLKIDAEPLKIHSQVQPGNEYEY